jgi:PHD/YefM family antitoxin component YafN of YafNO toxin-antitoxin module
MKQVSSTEAKQNFGALLDGVAREPIAIERHGKVKAILSAPDWVAGRGAGTDARHLARAQQSMLEKDRLIRHQRIAIDLLSLPAKARHEMVERALSVVEQWRRQQLCSADYIDRWATILRLPTKEIAQALVSDHDGWGVALRQNSPWTGVPA